MVNKWSIRREISRYPWTVLRRECKVSTGPPAAWGRRSRTFLASSQGRGRSTIYQLKIPGVDEVCNDRSGERVEPLASESSRQQRFCSYTLYVHCIRVILLCHIYSLRLHLLHFIRCSLVLSGPSYRASYSTARSIPALIVAYLLLISIFVTSHVQRYFYSSSVRNWWLRWKTKQITYAL